MYSSFPKLSPRMILPLYHNRVNIPFKYLYENIPDFSYYQLFSSIVMHPHKNRTSTIPIIYNKTFKSNNLQNFSVNHNFGYGVTQIHATGYYSSKSRSVIYFVVNRFQIAKLKMIASAIYPITNRVLRLYFVHFMIILNSK